MTDSTEKKNNAKNTTTIALITQDIKWIRDELAEIKGELKAVLGHYVQREELDKRLEDMQHQLDKRIEAIHGRVKEVDEKKLDEKAFAPYRAVWKVIGTLVVSGVVGAILTLILK